MTRETLLYVPRLGESVLEARILLFCKRPGEPVTRDEPLLEIETDKAAYVVESPEDGIVDRWEVQLGAVVPVGNVIGAIRHHPEASRNGALSPRDRWLRSQTPGSDSDFKDVPLSAPRRALNLAFERARRQAVPAWIEMELPWELLTRARASQTGSGIRLASIDVLAWAVSQAMRDNPAFRSELKGDSLREFAIPVLGVSVALANDELGTAAVCAENDLREFSAELREQIALVRKRNSAAALQPQVLLSYVAPLGITAAMPLVMPPAVATLCVGLPKELSRRKSAAMVLGFDHRVCNGSGAARFLRQVIDAIKNLGIKASV